MQLNDKYNIETVEEINNQVEGYIGEVIQELILKVADADNLLDQKEFETLINEINVLLNSMGKQLQDVIPEQMMLNYFASVDQATILLAEAGVTVPMTSALTAEGNIARGFQRKVHMEALEQIVMDTMMDMNAAIRTAQDSANNAIADVLTEVKENIAKGLIQGDPTKVVSQRVMKTFLDEGMTAFITKDGKNLPLDFYSRSVVRTKTREAGTVANMTRYKETGVGLAQINERNDTCPVCAPYNGKVVSLTGEHDGIPRAESVRLPPYHPFCRGVVNPYVEQNKTDAEIEEAKKQWEGFNPGKDTRTPAQKREYNRQQEIRRKANEEKKQFSRWQAALGAEAPKTIGAYRRMKRQNSPKYQELLSEYRSIAQQGASS